jgi:glycosyltransferase involved in cell wall biosynthesis
LRTLHGEAARLGLREKLALTRFTDGLIVLSTEARANILNQLNPGRPTIWVVPPAIDTARFDPHRVSKESARRNLGIGPDEYVFGIASRIRSTRKVDAAVKAFGIAQRKLPHLRLLIIGWGKKSNIEKCIWEPVKRFGMKDRVRHLGYLREEKYVEALAAVDAGVYLSSGSDKSCRTILEFMAMGKPLIVGRQGILSGLVDAPDNGFYVDADLQKVAEALVHLASEPLLSRTMGERSIARVKERFSLDTQAAATSKIYRLFLSISLSVHPLLELHQTCAIV